MRVSFCPGPGEPELDLELAVGVELGALRERLALVAGCDAARFAPLAAAGAALDDEHLTGTFPLVAGARLRVGIPVADDGGAFAAVRSPWHLAVVAGPDAGRLWPLSASVLIGRRPPGDGAEGPDDDVGLRLGDPRVSSAHLAVRLAGRRVWLRDVGSANGARRTWARSRHRLGARVPPWWVPWRAGDHVRLGSTVLELRRGPGHGPGGDAPRARTRSRTGRTSMLVASLGPALGSLALVAGTGNPALLALGLAGPALAGLLTLRAAPADPGVVGEQAEAKPAGRLAAHELTAALARAALTGEPVEPDGTLDLLAAGGALAVCGPGAREIAATLVLAAQPGLIEVHGPRTAAWRWNRWLADPTAPGPHVVVADGSPPRPEWVRPGSVLVLVDPERVPSWCSARLDASTWHGPEGARGLEVLPGSPAWAEEHARLVAAARCVAALGTAGLPGAVTLGELGLPLDAAGISAQWLEADGALDAVVGAGPGGAVDLVREGPHMLVAGTTGSGKSELLRALVASLALRYPPTALAFALVDFKGGAGFGALAGLPHVVGTVTDLDPLEASRALAGLAAELRSRKETLARAGVTDLRDWPVGAAETYPGRLVVVIDEFRALAEELPELMGALVRVATQGRSLGVHLVLATQRPSGVVSAELRANVALRLALRVTDAADSGDVLDVPDAAAIPSSLPGRALLRRGPGPVEELQVALVGGAAPPVRRADDDGAAAAAPPPAAARAPAPAPARVAIPAVDAAPRLAAALAAPAEPDAARSAPVEPDVALVAAVREAASRWLPAAPRPRAPWLAALPVIVPSEELPTPAAGSLPFGLADVPESQSRELAAWDPAAGHLLVVGGAGSGRSTSLATLAGAALARGWAVHAVGLPHLGAAPGLGTRCGPDDPRRLARLVTLLTAGPERTVLLVDDVEAAWRALERVARGAGAERFAELLRSRAVPVAMVAGSATGPWAAHGSARLVLPLADDVAEGAAGVPRALCGARRGPGRAVWLAPRAEPLVCQVALPPRAPSATPPATLPVRLAPVPLVAARDPLTRRRRGLAVGLGGDAGGVVALPADLGALVVGPPGSGRSTALAELARSARDRGIEVVQLAREGPLAGHGRGFARDHVLECLGEVGREAIVVVDDLDALERAVPEAADALEALVEAGTAVLASTTLAAALSAYRGVVAALRARRVGLVLGAHSPGSGEVFGSPLEWEIDPARAALPGRGVAQHGASLRAVQVFAPRG